jgi:hypothetical protein
MLKAETPLLAKERSVDRPVCKSKSQNMNIHSRMVVIVCPEKTPLMTPSQCQRKNQTYYIYIRTPLSFIPLSHSGFPQPIKSPQSIVLSTHVHFRKPSTPNVGTSMLFRPGTPSCLLLSTKLLHSLTTSVHSASARPAYFVSPPPDLFGRTSVAVPGTVPTRNACVGAGRRGGARRVRVSWRVGGSLL